MFRIRVERTLDLPINAAFGELADHAGYARFPGVLASEVLEPGERDPNGLGALRRVAIRGAVMWERITAFEPPNLLEYRIERSMPLPLRHQIGRVSLREVSEGKTHVVWVSEGYVDVPLLGRLLDPLVERGAGALFAAGLERLGQG